MENAINLLWDLSVSLSLHPNVYKGLSKHASCYLPTHMSIQSNLSSIITTKLNLFINHLCLHVSVRDSRSSTSSTSWLFNHAHPVSSSRFLPRGNWVYVLDSQLYLYLFSASIHPKFVFPYVVFQGCGFH